MALTTGSILPRVAAKHIRGLMFYLLNEYENTAGIALPQYNFKRRSGIPTRSIPISVSLESETAKKIFWALTKNELLWMT